MPRGEARKTHWQLGGSKAFLLVSLLLHRKQIVGVARGDGSVGGATAAGSTSLRGAPQVWPFFDRVFWLQRNDILRTYIRLNVLIADLFPFRWRRIKRPLQLPFI